MAQALGFLVDVGRLAIWLVLLIAVFVPLEWLCALHPPKFWRKQIGVDLAWYFINSLLPAAVLSVPLALAARALQGWNPVGFYTVVAAWPFWVKALLVLLVNDIGAYWGHRAMHTFPTCGVSHAIHHSAEEMDWLVNTRAHPFDMIFVRFSGLAPVYLLGLAQTTGAHLDPAVAILTIFGTGLDVFHPRQHARASWTGRMADLVPGVPSLAPHEGPVPGPQFRVRLPADRPLVRHRVAAETLAQRLRHQRQDALHARGPILRAAGADTPFGRSPRVEAADLAVAEGSKKPV